MPYARRDLHVFEGLEVVRHRPAMYIGNATEELSLCERLIQAVLDAVVGDRPNPTEVRVVLWSEQAMTIAFDGAPFPVEPYAADPNEVPHPALYRMFMRVALPGIRPLSFGAAVVNALSTRLTVATLVGGVRYRAAFSRGALLSLLTKSDPSEENVGPHSLTFIPDADVVPGIVGIDAMQAIRARVGAAHPSVPITLEDRSLEKPDWL